MQDVNNLGYFQIERLGHGGYSASQRIMDGSTLFVFEWLIKAPELPVHRNMDSFIQYKG